MNSLAARVGWSAAVVLAVFIVLTALALERAFSDSAHAAMRERLLAQLYLVMAATEVAADGTPLLPAPLNEPRLNLPDSGLYARITAADGALLWRSPSALAVTLPAADGSGREQFGRVGLAGAEFFHVGLRIDWETDSGSVPLRYSVFEHPAAFDEQMQRYRRSLWGWLAAMAVLLLLALAAALAWGLRPLRTVAAELRHIEAGRQQALERSYPREIRRLSDNINTLLQHERAQQRRYQHALADLAHSLKTPLAILRGINAGSQGALLEEQVLRMDDIVQHQLQRAATAGPPTLAAAVPLAPLVQRLLAALRKVYADKAIVLHCAVADELQFRGAEGDLMELLGNLLDNACKWCRREVRVSAQRQPGVLLLRVEDDGPGIAAADAEQAVQRGRRLDEATPGHGIGLALVRDIVTAYGGTLEIGRSAWGGAAIHVTLPG